MFAIALFVFTLYVRRPTWGDFESDVIWHLRSTERFQRGELAADLSGHSHRFGVYLVTISVSRVTGLDLGQAIALAQAAAVFAAFLVTLRVLRTQVGEGYGSRAGTLAALLLGIATPIYLPFNQTIMRGSGIWNGYQLYLGQGSPNVWHNPPYVLMTPFAIASFALIVRWLAEDRMRPLGGTCILAAVLLAATPIIKPSYVVTLLPALPLYWVVSRAEIRLDWRRLVSAAAIFGPLLAVLLAVFFVEVLGARGAPTRIRFGGADFLPFVVWSHFTPSLPVSWLVALAFPVATLAAYPGLLRRDRGLRLAWLMLLVGGLQFLLLAEVGPRKWHANWGWGYNIALRILYIYSLAALWRENRAVRSLAGLKRVAWGLLLLHGMSGALYLVRIVSGVGFG